MQNTSSTIQDVTINYAANPKEINIYKLIACQFIVCRNGARWVSDSLPYVQCGFGNHKDFVYCLFV